MFHSLGIRVRRLVLFSVWMAGEVPNRMLKVNQSRRGIGIHVTIPTDKVLVV